MVVPGTVAPLPLKVTPAVNAKALPFIVLVLSIVMAWLANMVPLKTADVPITAEEVTCQKIFWACAPPSRMTLTPLAT